MSRTDITLDDMDLMLVRNARARSAAGTEIPEIATEQFVQSDVPAQQDTWHLGGFYSQRTVAGTAEHAGGYYALPIVPGTYDYGQNVWCLNPRLVMPGPQMTTVTLSSSPGPMNAAVEENGDIYIVGGAVAYRVASGVFGSTTLTVHQNFKSSNNAVSAVQFLGDGYVGTVNSSNEPGDMWKISGTTWSTSSGGHGYLTTTYYSSAPASVAPRWLAGSTTQTAIEFTSSDPLVVANWGTGVTVREAGSLQIKNLISWRDHTYIATDRGLYDFDGGNGNTLNLTPQIEKLVDSTYNGRAVLSLNGWIYYGWRRGLLRVRAYGQDANQVQDVTPGYGVNSENPVRGAVTALNSWGPWVIAAVYNGTDTYICFGRELGQGEPSYGPSPMLWHPGVIYLPSVQCFLIHISGLTSPPTLIVGFGSGLKWGYLPRTENPLQDSEFRFETSFKLFTGANDWGYPTIQKDYSEEDFEIDNAGTGVTMTVNVSLDGGTYSQFGVARSSPRSSIQPSDTFRGNRIAERWDGAGTNTSGPVVRGVVRRADLLVKARSQRQYLIKLAEWDEDRLSGRFPADVGRIYSKLQALPDKGPVTCRDEFGNTLTVRVHRPINYQEMEVDGEDRRKARVLAVPVTMSVLKSMGIPWSWNDGTTWGSGKVWS